MVDINKSILNKNNFRLLIDKIPTTEYYIKKCNIPGVQFTEIAQGAGVGWERVVGSWLNWAARIASRLF